LRSSFLPSEIDQIERKNLAIERRESSLPTGHMALAATPHRRVDRLSIAAVDPEPIRQVRRAEIGFAPGVITMAGDAVGGENSLAGIDFRCRNFLADSGVGEAAHVGDDVVDFILLEYLIAPERLHLRRRGVRMRGIDADTEGFWDIFGIAAPQPRRRRQVRESLATLRIRPVARQAVV